MATGIQAKAVAFVAQHMAKNPDITMSELKEKGSKQGINVYPLIIGLAKKELGMTSGPRKAKKAGRKKRAAKKMSRRGRPPASAGAELSSLGAVVEMVSRLEDDVQGMREALSEIAAIASRYA